MNEYQEYILDIIKELRGKICDVILNTFEVIVKMQTDDDVNFWLMVKTQFDYLRERSEKKEPCEEIKNNKCKDCDLAKSSSFLSNISNMGSLLERAGNCCSN